MNTITFKIKKSTGFESVINAQINDIDHLNRFKNEFLSGGFEINESSHMSNSEKNDQTEKKRCCSCQTLTTKNEITLLQGVYICDYCLGVKTRK